MWSYDEGGQLTEAVRRKTLFCSAFLGRMRKAPIQTLLMFYCKYLDEGRLTDNKEGLHDFPKTPLSFMRSNMGSHMYSQEKVSNQMMTSIQCLQKRASR